MRTKWVTIGERGLREFKAQSEHPVCAVTVIMHLYGFFLPHYSVSPMRRVVIPFLHSQPSLRLPAASGNWWALESTQAGVSGWANLPLHFTSGTCG